MVFEISNNLSLAAADSMPMPMSMSLSLSLPLGFLHPNVKVVKHFIFGSIKSLLVRSVLVAVGFVVYPPFLGYLGKESDLHDP